MMRLPFRRDDRVKVKLSPHAAELLDIYASALEMDLGATLSRDQAAERVIRMMLDKNLKEVIDARAAVLLHPPK